MKIKTAAILSSEDICITEEFQYLHYDPQPLHNIVITQTVTS